jgi:hypothetical protein
MSKAYAPHGQSGADFMDAVVGYPVPDALRQAENPFRSTAFPGCSRSRCMLILGDAHE